LVSDHSATPPIAVIEGVIGRDLVDRLVADDLDKTRYGALTAVGPDPKLVKRSNSKLWTKKCK
jgi:hypothetical protein